MLDSYLPVSTYGDGNCFFRAASLSLYGYEDAHLALRWMAAVEVAMRRERYDISCSPVCHELLRHSLIVCPSFDDVFGELTTAGVEWCVVSIIAVCSALGITCDSYYPPRLADVSPPLTTTITGSCTSSDLSIKIMWTTTLDVPDTGDVRINHFVPLLERPRIASNLPGEVREQNAVTADAVRNEVTADAVQDAVIGDRAAEAPETTSEDPQSDVSADVDCNVQPLRKPHRRRRRRRRKMCVDRKDAESVHNDVSNDSVVASQSDCDAEPVRKRRRRHRRRRSDAESLHAE